MSGEMELYLHIPFCVKKCGYCDFLSAPADVNTQHAYALALCAELRLLGSQWRKHPVKIRSVFIGGGTPTWLDAKDMEQILSTLWKEFAATGERHVGAGEETDVKEKACAPEVTIECNPGTVTREKLLLYKKYGINRLSIGLQSADERELCLLGRIHTFEQFLKTYEMARELRFTNINVDVMAGLPYQTWERLEETLKKVTRLAPEHISLYDLIVEEGTPFFEKYAQDVKRRRQGEATRFLPDEDAELLLLRRAKEFLERRGYMQYEISNYARKGKECIHNIGYWRRVPYIGLGIGAASLLEERRCRNVTDLDAYIKGCGLLAAEESKEGEAGRKRHQKYQYASPLWDTCEELKRSERMEEFMFLGLRMREGILESDFAGLFQTSIDEVYGPVLESLRRRGLLVRRQGRIFLTQRGEDVSNVVLAEFLL